MSDTYAPTAKPIGAAVAWATKDGIFVEIPSKAGGPPFICRYHKTESGLAAALNILIEHQEAAPRTIPRDHPAITKPAPTPRAPWATDADRERVRGIMKRLKTI